MPSCWLSWKRRGSRRPRPSSWPPSRSCCRASDVLGQAATGTGKTAAFGLPMLDRMLRRETRDGRPRGVVLVPTRELAMQVAEAIGRLSGGAVRVAACFWWPTHGQPNPRPAQWRGHRRGHPWTLFRHAEPWCLARRWRRAAGARRSGRDARNGLRRRPRSDLRRHAHRAANGAVLRHLPQAHHRHRPAPHGEAAAHPHADGQVADGRSKCRAVGLRGTQPRQARGAFAAFVPARPQKLHRVLPHPARCRRLC